MRKHDATLTIKPSRKTEATPKRWRSGISRRRTTEMGISVQAMSVTVLIKPAIIKKYPILKQE